MSNLRSLAEQQLSHTLDTIELDGLGEKIPGKVRDSYVVGDKRVLVASDRLSAFDRILTTIPFKGQLLSQMAAYWFEQTDHIVPNHTVAIPHPQVFVAQEVEIVPIEVVIRGYLTGSAWRDYEAGKDVSGISLPKGLKKSERFETPLITPSTKAAHGEHDEPISSEEIIKQEIVPVDLWEEICEKALALFAFGTQKAAEQGLILVDTKYEFGTKLDQNGARKLVLADEVHTQDSSRYWLLNSYQERFEASEDPDMLDKEFVRRWLIEQGYMGDGTPPEISAEFRIDTCLKYVEAYEKMTGREFVPEVGDQTEKIRASVAEAL